MKIKYNSRNVDRSKQGGDGELPQPGRYVMKYESATFEEPGGDKQPRIVFVLRIDESEPKHKNFPFWDYVLLDVDWKMDQHLQAIGIDTEKNPEGEVDLAKFKGKKVLARVKADKNPAGEYRPKLAWVGPYKPPAGSDQLEQDEHDEPTFDDGVDDTVEPFPNGGTPAADDGTGPTKEQVALWGEDGDLENEDAMESLTALAEEYGFNADDYATWAELAEAIIEQMPDEEDGDGEPEAAAVEDQDYESWDVAQLKAELESRELPVKGTKAALIARLRQNDADPF